MCDVTAKQCRCIFSLALCGKTVLGPRVLQRRFSFETKRTHAPFPTFISKCFPSLLEALMKALFLTTAPASLSCRPRGWWWFCSRCLHGKRGTMKRNRSFRAAETSCCTKTHLLEKTSLNIRAPMSFFKFSLRLF